MTTREIADAVGKDERTVRRWTARASDKMSVIADKMSVSSPMNPADFDLEETLAIIETGMGKNAAAVYRQSVPYDKMSAVTDKMSASVDYDALAKTVAIAVSAAMAPMLARLMTGPPQPQAPKQLALGYTDPDSMTLRQYCNQHNINYPNDAWLSKNGRAVSALCRESQVIPSIVHEYGIDVHSYPSYILSEHFKEYFSL